MVSCRSIGCDRVSTNDLGYHSDTRLSGYPAMYHQRFYSRCSSYAYNIRHRYFSEYNVSVWHIERLKKGKIIRQRKCEHIKNVLDECTPAVGIVLARVSLALAIILRII